jgi:hypothetical protein
MQPVTWALVEVGLWMRLGISGAAVAVAAPLMAVAGEVPWTTGVLSLAFGSALALFAWRRTNVLLGGDVPAARERRPIVTPARSRAAA